MSTASDRQVLNSILNPNLPLGEGVFDPEEENASHDIQDTPSSVPQEAKSLERDGMVIAENGNVDKSIEIFTKVVEMYPDYASVYNNRAQAFRLKGDTARAMEDLEKALRFSGAKGKVGVSALCQRGIIQRKLGHDDSAIEDFKEAAALGSAFAKSMLVEMNPYAAMCNAMLKNVFEAMSVGKQPRDPTVNIEPTSSG